MVLQVEAESICALTIFDFPSWTRCKWAKNFFAGLRVALHSSTLHSASSSASSSTKFDCCLLPTCFLVPPLHARAKWPTIPHLLHLLPNAGHWCWRGLGWLPRHQKHSGVGGAEVWFSRVDLFVTFTCSYWVLQAVLINWFAKAVAWKLFAISTTSRNLTLVCAAPRYLWPLPISFTRRVSDVKPAINWVSHKLVSEIFIFALWSLISYTGFLRTDRFVFILQQAKKLLSFTGDPDACAIIFS